MTQLTVYLVATHYTNTLENSLASLRVNNFHYKLLAKDEPWGGWKWRTQQYLSAIADTEEVSIFLDAFDTLCQRSSKDFINNFEAFSKDIVIGCEWYCGNSSNCGDVKEWWKFNGFTQTPTRKNINAGCIIGKSKALRQMFTWILEQPFEDDQLALSAWVNKHPELCNLDYGSSLVYNAHIVDMQKTPTTPYFLHFPGPLLKYNLFPRYNSDAKKILEHRARIVYCSEWISAVLYFIVFSLSLVLLSKLV